MAPKCFPNGSQKFRLGSRAGVISNTNDTNALIKHDTTDNHADNISTNDTDVKAYDISDDANSRTKNNTDDTNNKTCSSFRSCVSTRLNLSLSQ